MNDDEDLLFASDDEETIEIKSHIDRWKILVVDDDSSIHQVTTLALEDFSYANRELEILHAYSGKEAKEIMAEHHDIAVILLDVVMESEHAGLDVAKHIRETLHNPFLRIILRTGQPGQAPERQVILEYDINDYKEKTELTAKKLFTTLVAALRTYQHLMTINRNRIGLEKIIEATASIFKTHSLEKFVAGLLDQMLSILSLEGSSFYCHTSGFVSQPQGSENNIDQYIIVAATGDFENAINRSLREAIDEATLGKITAAHQTHKTLYFDNECVINFRYINDYESFVYLKGYTLLDEVDKRLIETFCSNISIAYESVFLTAQ